MTKTEIAARAQIAVDCYRVTRKTHVIDFGPTATEYWWIETTGPEGQDMAIAFSGSWAEAKAEARLNPGACIHHVRDWSPAADVLAA